MFSKIKNLNEEENNKDSEQIIFDKDIKIINSNVIKKNLKKKIINNSDHFY